MRGDGVTALHHNVRLHADAGADHVVVNSRDREQRRDGHLSLARAVGDDHHVGACAHGLLDARAQGLKRRLERALPRLARVGGRETRGMEALAVKRGDALELVLGENGIIQTQELAVLAGVFEHVAVVAQVEHGRRHEALAQRVDGRVGDLRKELVEVVEERARMSREHGERNVGAHRGQGRLARVGHGTHGLLDVIEVIAVTGQALGERHLGVDGLEGVLLALGKICHREGLLVNPVAEGLLSGKVGLDLVIPDDAALGGVDDEHLAGTERARLQDLVGLDGEGTRLGGKDHAVVVRDVVAGRAQAVPVQRGAGDAAVREGDGGGAVPALGEHGLVAVIGAASVGELLVLVPRLGEQHRDGAREGPAVHGEELEDVVEDGGVRALAVDDGHHAAEVRAKHGRVELGLAGANPVDVAAQGVDLAVVDDIAVGVRALPAGRGVSGVAGVHEGQRRLCGGVVQVQVEVTHLGGDEHALVHDGARAHGAHIEDLALERVVGCCGLLDRAAAHVELALELVTCRNVCRTPKERLVDGGHAGKGRLAQVMRVDGHLSPEEQGHALLGAALLEDAACHLRALRVLREEDHGHAVLALVGEQVAVLLSLLAEEAVRNLEQDAGAVAGVSLQALTAAVLEVHKERERVVEQLV